MFENGIINIKFESDELLLTSNIEYIIKTFVDNILLNKLEII